MAKRPGVVSAFRLGLLHSETGFRVEDTTLRVDTILRGDPSLHSHLQDVRFRDQNPNLLEVRDTELSGSIIDEWARVGRIRSRLLTLCSHFKRDDFILSTVLGPVIPASALDSTISIPKQLLSELLQTFRSEVTRRIRRSAVVDVALVGWLELEEFDGPTSYIRSWWRRRGDMIWGGSRPPRKTYVLHAHFAGVILITSGGCSAETFSTMLTPAFPWLRAVNTEPWRASKTKEASAKDISRYAWKLGNKQLSRPRPFPAASEIMARAQFWCAVGNPNRDFDIRISLGLRSSERTCSGARRSSVRPHDRAALASLWPS